MASLPLPHPCAPSFPLIGLVIGLSLVSTSLWRGGLSSGRSNSWVTWKDSHGRNRWGGGSHINPSPQVCLSLVVLLSAAPHPPILSHFSLLSFVTLVTELYELIMGPPLLVASHWVRPIGGTCGGRRGDGIFLPRCSPSVSVWAPLELQLSSCCSSSCPFVIRVGEGVKAPCCLRTPCCSPHPPFTYINSPFFTTLQLNRFSEILLPAENLHRSLFSSQASWGWVRADFL